MGLITAAHSGDRLPLGPTGTVSHFVPLQASDVPHSPIPHEQTNTVDTPTGMPADATRPIKGQFVEEAHKVKAEGSGCVPVYTETRSPQSQSDSLDDDSHTSPHTHRSFVSESGDKVPGGRELQHAIELIHTNTTSTTSSTPRVIEGDGVERGEVSEVIGDVESEVEMNEFSAYGEPRLKRNYKIEKKRESCSVTMIQPSLTSSCDSAELHSLTSLTSLTSITSLTSPTAPIVNLSASCHIPSSPSP
eukprot:GHVN01061649.1.p1 GENE.GHVN01061649.1~~GHVN01061649.1.p1  ORF type:complete len:273 (-),score=109.70 GHVN01061649.1:106-846(-)